MDSLVDICLKESGIQVLPASIVQHCRNLVSLDLSLCSDLITIEVDFCGLKNLKKLHLLGCDNLETQVQEIFKSDCCLEVLSLPLVNSYSFGFHHLPRFITQLTLRSSILVNKDIPSNIDVLSSLQVLDFSDNTLSQIHFNLVQLTHLKFLNISNCKNLVELPGLPSSIAVLNADGCDSLKITADFQTFKWLWKVTLGRKVCGGENVLRSMFQGNAINEDHFVSFRKRVFDISRKLGFDISNRAFGYEKFTLELPMNWYSDYTGFLICVAKPWDGDLMIRIKQEYQSCVFIESDEESEINSMCYIPFSSLMSKPLWKGNISFFIRRCEFKVELVPGISKSGSTERSTDCSEFWDEQLQGKKTFTIEHDSWNSLEIVWLH